MSVAHHTLTHRRDLRHPVDVVFAAWADAEVKREWFDLSDDDHAGWHCDFHVGGTEAFRSAAGVLPEVTYQARFSDILKPERIVLTAEITVDGRRTSVSVTTVEFETTGGGTRVTVTEQITFLDGLEEPADRRGGTARQLARLAEVLDTTD